MEMASSLTECYYHVGLRPLRIHQEFQSLRNQTYAVQRYYKIVNYNAVFH